MSFLQRVGVFFCGLWTVFFGFMATQDFGGTFDYTWLSLKFLVVGDVIIIALFLAVDWILFPHHYRSDEASPEEESPHTIDLN